MELPEALDQLFDRIGGTVGEVLRDLDDAALRWRPDPEANTIAWLVWHLARVQDDHIAELAGEPQVWVGEAWAERFGLPAGATDTGYGHTSKEVAAVDPGDTETLLAYHQRVTAATRHYVRGLRPDDLDRIIDPSYDPPVTVGARLLSVAMDTLQHVGQAGYLRGLHERRG